MKKYRKKPIVIEAIQWTGKNNFEVSLFCGRSPSPYTGVFTLPYPTLDIVEEKEVNKGDYIIRVLDLDDEFYPCEPSTFESLYEEVE